MGMECFMTHGCDLGNRTMQRVVLFRIFYPEFCAPLLRLFFSLELLFYTHSSQKCFNLTSFCPKAGFHVHQVQNTKNSTKIEKFMLKDKLSVCVSTMKNIYFMHSSHAR